VEQREEVPGGSIRFHKEHHESYPSPDIIRDMKRGDKMGGACSTHEGDEKCKQNFSRETLKEKTARKM
jgi:hypothetical protein